MTGSKNCGTFTQWNSMQQRKKELLPFVTAWMELERIVLSEISQVVKEIPYDLTYKWNLINKTNKQSKYNQRH